MKHDTGDRDMNPAPGSRQNISPFFYFFAVLPVDTNNRNVRMEHVRRTKPNTKGETMYGRNVTNSTKEGWTKTGKGQYVHENGHKVQKTSQGWEVSGPNKNDGYVFSTMWVAMQAAAKTPAQFVR